MKNHIILSALAAVALAACNNQPKTDTENIPVDSTAVAVAVDTVSTCYTFKNDKMMVTLHTDAVGNKVSGHLAYNYAEKDNNTGTILGQYKGDTLYADYTFVSEGKESVREVAFVRSGNTLTEGYGDVTEAGGKVTFKDKSKLNYASGTVVSETPCAGPQ